MSISRQNNKPYYDPQELIKCYNCQEKFPRAIFANHQDNCEETFDPIEERDLAASIGFDLNKDFELD